ncbi:LuxR C-terminal-related transcriptional regulator [Microbacterium sp.]|uniref:helix-turn-helix transcriptional regulator n=1 Tax=Microbacterium sp. TaxID=51671 RepID=UPI002626AA60|nr:LuxR C-terminal-related transcriptional regulator [Microbacterium sp.]
MPDHLPRSVSDTGVREALAAGDIDHLEEAFDVLWYELPTRFGPEILAAVGGLDASTFLRRPRLMHLTLLAHCERSSLGEDPPLGKMLQLFRTHGRHYASRLTDFDDPSDLRSAGTIAMIAARLDGAYRRADTLGTWLDDRLNALETRTMLPWAPHHIRTKPGWLSAQRGLTATLGGDLDYAVRLFTSAFTEAGTAPFGHFAGANAAANLALIAAVRGHVDIARTWIARMEGTGPLPDWIEHLTTLGAKIAAALIAIDEGDPTLAKHHLDRVGPGTQHVELWPFIVYVRATYDAFFGDPHAGLVELEAARLTHGALGGTGHETARLLLRSEAKLLLRAPNATRVLNLADEHQENFPPQYAAWAQLYGNRPHQAVRTAARALRQTAVRLPLNDLIELHAALAVAHLRSGRTEQATAAFQSAVRLRASPAHVQPFLNAPRDDVAQLAGLAGVVDPLLSVSAGARTTSASEVTIVELTPREMVVLRSLDHGDTAVATAQKFGVSPATVRSQVASIYRKLGVSGRSAALARAHELGLLSNRPSPGERRARSG